MKFELEGRSTMNSKNVPNPPVNINHLWEHYTATFEKKFGVKSYFRSGYW